MGGTSPEASTESPEASVQGLGGGPIQRHRKHRKGNPASYAPDPVEGAGPLQVLM